MKRPLVVLVGGSQGQWQYRASRELSWRVPTAEVVETAMLVLPMVCEWARIADVVVSWCGDGEDVHYLQDWILVGHILASQTIVVVGVSTIADHPMAPQLRDLATAVDVHCPGELSEVIDIAVEHCRAFRETPR